MTLTASARRRDPSSARLRGVWRPSCEGSFAIQLLETYERPTGAQVSQPLQNFEMDAVGIALRNQRTSAYTSSASALSSSSSGIGDSPTLGPGDVHRRSASINAPPPTTSKSTGRPYTTQLNPCAGG